MDNDERRKNTRVTFHTTMDVTFADAVYTDRATENLSTKGVFIDNVFGRTLGEICSLTLKLSGTATDLSLAMNGEVVRMTKKGIGIHFKDMDLDSFSHLRRIIYYNCGNPDKIDEDYIDKSRG